MPINLIPPIHHNSFHAGMSDEHYEMYILSENVIQWHTYFNGRKKFIMLTPPAPKKYSLMIKYGGFISRLF